MQQWKDSERHKYRWKDKKKKTGEGQSTVHRKQGQLERKRRIGTREALHECLECRRTGPQQYTGQQGGEAGRWGRRGGGGEGGEVRKRPDEI